MSRNKIDDITRSHLLAESHDLDKNAIWDEIKHKIPRKKKRRRPFIILFGIGILILSGLLIINFIFNKDQNVILNDKANSSLKEIFVDKKNDSYEEGNPNSNLSHQMEIEEAITSWDANKEIVKNETSKESSNLDGVNRNKILKSILIDKYRAEQNFIKNRDVVINETEILLNNIGNTEFKNRKTSEFVTENKREPMETNVIDLKQPTLLEQHQDLLDSRALSQFPILENKLSEVYLENNKYPNILEYLAFSDDDKNNNDKAKFSIISFINYYNYNRFLDTNDQELSSYIENKKAKELKRFGSEIGLGLKYTMNNGINFGIGISKLQINERFIHSQVVGSTVQSVVSDTAKFRVVNGIRTYISGTLKEVTTTTRFIEHTNKHIFFSIPISAGYQKKFGNYLLTGSLQYDFNVSYNFKGYSFDPSNKLNTINSQSFGLSNRVTGLIGGNLSLGKQFSNRLSMQFTMNYKQQLGNIWIGDRINQSYRVLGAGVKAEFNL